MLRAGSAIIVTGPTEEAPKSTCPFAFFAQLHPVDLPEDIMQELEEETQRPTGIWTVSPPKMSLSGLLISKECGIMYQVTKTEGLRYAILRADEILPYYDYSQIRTFADHGLSSGR